MTNTQLAAEVRIELHERGQGATIDAVDDLQTIAIIESLERLLNLTLANLRGKDPAAFGA